jgi:hypothetical protein
MSHQPVPEDVRDLILRHIHSVAQLEALLFLRGRPGESWDTGSIARRLYAPADEVATALGDLCSAGFLRRDDAGFRYDGSPGQQATVERLAAAYARHLIPITHLIHGKPRNITAFSDAFKFRRDE